MLGQLRARLAGGIQGIKLSAARAAAKVDGLNDISMEAKREFANAQRKFRANNPDLMTGYKAGMGMGEKVGNFIGSPAGNIATDFTIGMGLDMAAGVPLGSSVIGNTLGAVAGQTLSDFGSRYMGTPGAVIGQMVGNTVGGVPGYMIGEAIFGGGQDQAQQMAQPASYGQMGDASLQRMGPPDLAQQIPQQNYTGQASYQLNQEQVARARKRLEEQAALNQVYASALNGYPTQ